MFEHSALYLLGISAVLWLMVGIAGIAVRGNMFMVTRVLFPFGAAVALMVGLAGIYGLLSAPQSLLLPLGLPNLPFHLRLDALSSVFVVLLGFATVGISLFTAGYFRNEGDEGGEGHDAGRGLHCLKYHIFLMGMLLVLLADDAYTFMVAWETMALSSFLLVNTNHKISEIRHAAYLYLLVAHVGALAILLGFGVMTGGDGVYTFAAMRAQEHSAFWAALAFLLALFGFGAKAGLLPLHVWLPLAHPAAPAPVSALMSGVMLKTAIYGILRVSFDLLGATFGEDRWWWGALTLALGLATALFGVLYSTVQSDMKRLLAYSSIENIGMITAGIGLTLLFHAYHMQVLASLALSAVFYLCLAHAGFKSLLFLGTGSVMHATSQRSLGHLGGLIHNMPWVAWLVLLGVIAGAGLPPLSGFVAEWMLLQAFLFSPSLPHSWLNMLVPVMAALVALIAALAAFTMVKYYGMVFLGQKREDNLDQAHDAGIPERAGLLWLSLYSVALGILPCQIIHLLDSATLQLLGSDLSAQLEQTRWWILAPISESRANYQPLAFLLFILLCIWLVRAGVHFYSNRALASATIRRSTAWNCGYPFQTARMQDTAEGFSQPIRRLFGSMFRVHRYFPAPGDKAPECRIIVEDHFWYWLYLPLARFLLWVASLIGKLQGGRISFYLIYSFLTMLLLLIVANW